MQKIKNIEFLRVFLIIAIVILHTCCSSSWALNHVFPDVNFFDTVHNFLRQANNGVEGFFIIAGFLLFMTFKKSVSVKEFVIKKYIRLSPVIIFATIICAIASLFGVMHFKVFPNLMTALLLNHFIICFSIVSNPVLWFTSALFAGLLLFFLLIKYSNGKNIIWFSITISSISYLLLEIFQKGVFADPYHNYLCIFNVGFMRALGGIGLGIFIACLYKNYSKFFNLNYLITTIFELIFLFLTIYWMVLPHHKHNCIEFVIVFSLLLLFFIIKKGFISKFFEKDLWVKLGKYQYSLYVTHYVIGKILVNGLWKNNVLFVHVHPVMALLITLFIIFTAGVLTFYMVELPCTKYLKEKIKF